MPGNITEAAGARSFVERVQPGGESLSERDRVPADRLGDDAPSFCVTSSRYRARYAPTGDYGTVANPLKWPFSTCPALPSRSTSENGFSIKATFGSSRPWEASTGLA